MTEQTTLRLLAKLAVSMTENGRFKDVSESNIIKNVEKQVQSQLLIELINEIGKMYYDTKRIRVQESPEEREFYNGRNQVLNDVIQLLKSKLGE